MRDPEARLLQVNGPRHGDHSVWITHIYERREGRYEFVTREVIPLSGWRIVLAPKPQGGDDSSP